MTKLSLYLISSLTLLCVACQNTPPVKPTPTPQPQPTPVVVTPPPAPAPISTQPTYSQNTLVIFYNEAFKSAVISAIQARQADIIYDFNLMNGVAIRLNSNDDVQQAMQQLSKINGVIAVNRDKLNIID